MATPLEIVCAYCALWNENDAQVRARLLELCWSDDGAIHIGDRIIAGRSAVAAEAALFRARCPEDRAVATSDVAFVGRWFRFTAEVCRPDRSVYSRMLDVGEFGPDGRIRLIATFVDDAPDSWSDFLDLVSNVLYIMSVIVDTGG